ncbi:MAG: hypothetical protein Q7T61_15770 [Caulobacter sp.]|nr:hypothetical protein [Caulobacter sp.]
MRTLLATAFAALAFGGAVQAEDLSCNEILARVDTFGRLRWKDPIKAPPAWAVTVNCKADCEFSEPEGTRYALGDGGLLDKELKAGTATPWPWGLDSKDGPAEAKAKLSRLLPGKSLAVSPDDPATWFVVIPPCMTWIEVSFEGERGIRAVSLNAQP